VRETDFLGGFAKGLSIIEAFGGDQPRLTIAEAAKRTGLDRATARRCLLTLSGLGYADYDGKFFALTPKILRLGQAYLSATPLPAIVQPHLDLLSERAGQSASVSVLDGTEIVYVARASLKKIMSISLMPGSRMPAYCTSMGRVLLAALPEAKAREVLEHSSLQARTPLTKTGVAEIMAELAKIRATGHAVIDQELELGLCSIAVPLINARGETIAALNIGAPATSASAADMPGLYLEQLTETQQALRSILR
jgi:IclR family transcriptional regulator, pca regulon regulatory protein